MTTVQIAYVEWVDSSSLPGRIWHDTKEVQDLTPVVCRAAGFIVGESKEHLTIASHMSADEIAGEIAIPKCAIRKIKRWRSVANSTIS